MRKDRKSSQQAQANPRLQDTVRLSADGLAKVLGDLESRVLRTVWALRRPSSARTVHERIEKQHPISSLTTITVLNKLVTKGILAREKSEDVFHYRARLNEDEFMAHASRRVVEGILSFGPDAVAASFVDVLAETNPEKLAELGRLIRRKLRESDSK
ncbi:MAG: BlaI/MecI/CopY family transcriptional regulator [Gemmatimonadaceae bacterium]